MALEKHVALEEPGNGVGDLVGGKLADGDRKDPVELLQGALHGLGHEEEDHDERDDVEAGVEAKRADGIELSEQEGECGSENGGLGSLALRI